MIKFATALFFLLMGPLLLSSEKVTQWKRLYKKHGVEVFTATVTGSKFVAFKGTVTIDASPDFIVNIFKDESRWGEWTDLLLDGKILPPKKKDHLIFYQAFQSPPLVADRDAVYGVTFSSPSKEGVVTVTGVSTENRHAPKTIGVRMKIDFSRWILTPRNGKTFVELEMHADPGGWIPSWVVNMVQRGYPYDLLSALRKHAQLLARERGIN